ncbi:hypothetical protein ElyMa_002575600 [Elysia marginata]|uniref:Uncharacterized protein n=1 Tax=Elysia marginata TaxID=1093978 RepID=A0AAV4H1T5_9GAST|nr:hypothetical protein ElyMa_002575600 [Elysia marginata]
MVNVVLTKKSVLKLQHLKTSIERVRGSKCYKFNDSIAHTNPETALQDDASDPGSDFQFEKVLLHKQFQSKMGEKAVDEEPSTNNEAHSCDVHTIQDLIKDMVNRATGIVDDNSEAMNVGNTEPTRDDEITTIKRRPPKRVNKAKERKKSLNYTYHMVKNTSPIEGRR